MALLLCSSCGNSSEPAPDPNHPDAAVQTDDPVVGGDGGASAGHGDDASTSGSSDASADGSVGASDDSGTFNPPWSGDAGYADSGSMPSDDPPVDNPPDHPPVDDPPVDNPPDDPPDDPPVDNPPIDPPANGGSIEVGHTRWGSDYTERPDVPKGVTMFSVWTKIPDPGSSYPWKRGNMNVYLLRGSNWYLWCLVGNSSAESPTDARYNANSMLFIRPGDMWVGDYSYFESGGSQPDAPYRDWVWVAWQVIVESDAFTLRQWLKFGPNSPVIAAGDNVLTFAKVRSIMMNNGWRAEDAEAWVPDDAVSFQVGADQGYLTQARMQALSSEPTLEQLEEIARGGAVESAWGQYPFTWVDGGPYLQDISGHGRDLSIAPGGALYAGPAGPAF